MRSRWHVLVLVLSVVGLTMPPTLASAELVLDAGKKDAESLAEEVIAFLQRTGKIR